MGKSLVESPVPRPLPGSALPGNHAAPGGGIRRRLRIHPLTLAFFVCAGSWAGVSAPAADLNLWLEPGPQVVQGPPLPLGDDLWVGAFGLVGVQQASLRLLDPDGAPLLSAPLAVRFNGAARPVPLWRATGIRGCQTPLSPVAYPFVYPHEAEAWIGERVTVELLDGSSRIAAVRLEIVPPEDGYPHLVDVSLCPRRTLADTEAALLDSHDGWPGQGLEALTTFVVPCRDQDPWNFGEPLQDARWRFPRGQTVLPNQIGAPILLWHPFEVLPGRYVVVIERTDDPGRGHLSENDEILPPFLLYDLDFPPSDGGLLIDEWGCP
ncbi:MAG: hypothetical protein MI919_06595 [Holophagales bacterium]|nr:hypothetical protein [Holophagales bacterium]